MTLYGIPNCDTVKKARAWLAANGLAVPFHDIRKDALEAERLSRWLVQAGRDTLLNRRGTTWRQLPEAEKAAVVDDASAIALMLAHPSIIKRPVLETDDGGLLVGFDEHRYRDCFGK